MKKKIYLSSNIYLINKKFKKNQYYHYFHEYDNVIIIPKIKNKFILVKQKRIPIQKYNYEFPMGRIEKGFSNIKVAINELQEETGYMSIDKPKKITSFYADPGRNTRKIHVYVAENLRKISKPEKGIKILICLDRKVKDLIRKKFFNSSAHLLSYFYYNTMK